jgi:3-hydroxybutyryl-CoA dehydrogenase
VGVVGAGTMGAGIAQVALEAGDSVALYDVVPGAVEQARARIADGLARRASKLGLADSETEAWVSDRIGRLEGVATLEAVAQDAFLVIEAAVEDLALKRQVFATLDARAPTGTILATNTSALPVASIAADASRRSRIVGLHFFNPAPLMPLVEVVIGRETDAATAARAEAIVERWGKTPIRCADSPGFVVNRINRPFTLVPLRLLEGGTATIEEIDGAMRGAGFPQGPFEHIDLIGLDVNLATSTAVHAGLGSPARLAPSALQGRLVAARRLGRKRGVGFYEYDASGHRVRPGPGFGRRGGKHVPQRPEAIANRVRLALANEAYFALGDGVATADRIDLALRLGASHPQGPLEWAVAQGLDAVHAELQALEALEGERFAPAPALVEAVAAR